MFSREVSLRKVSVREVNLMFHLLTVRYHPMNQSNRWNLSFVFSCSSMKVVMVATMSLKIQTMIKMVLIVSIFVCILIVLSLGILWQMDCCRFLTLWYDRSVQKRQKKMNWLYNRCYKQKRFMRGKNIYHCDPERELCKFCIWKKQFIKRTYHGLGRLSPNIFFNKQQKTSFACAIVYGLMFCGITIISVTQRTTMLVVFIREKRNKI